MKELESNKMIAQFMGGIFLRREQLFDKRIIEEIKYPIGSHPYINNSDYEITDNVAYLRYHCDWSWLMPVIEKIINDDLTYPRTFGMISDTGQMMFRFDQCCLFQADTLIGAAYLAVVDLLERIDRYSQADEE